MIPAFTDINFPTPANAFPNNVPIPFNVTRSANVTFPSNVTSAYINFYEQQNGNDEFWYTLQPPFREFRIFINNTLVATVEPYPNVQTGGGDLFLWQPILAIGAELYPPHVINLSPYLSLLHGKQQIRVEVINDESLWIRSALNFMVNTSSSPVSSYTLSNSYLFVNSYIQNPPTNFTTESIPLNASYLNDTEGVQEVLSASGLTVTNSYVAEYSSIKTDTFFSNATEYDPSFDILQKTPTGYLRSTVETFFLNETITEYSSATYYLLSPSSHESYGSISIINTKQEYFQINGTTTIDYYLNDNFSLVSVGIGFNITQIRNITDYQNVTYSINGTIGGYSLFSVNNTMVTGSGFFVGTVVKGVITSLIYNHAMTTKTIHSLSELDGQVTDYYNLYEVAVNNSLVLRNGQLIVYEVSQGS